MKRYETGYDLSKDQTDLFGGEEWVIENQVTSVL